ncbi:hypothetical protein EYC80_008639 [Monilinia laxa]|uniref:BZIP domain-containing protein n=1 Tax=Monilinia laxa TaxID=61186 RepID=A0A5N6K0X8_MONLA|nr:hypothetical protein EYC80_008639 [Monilinia laxa]
MSTPNLKFEQSPAESLAESFTSTPGHQYPSLFHPQPSMEPLQAMTPQSFDEDSMFGDDIGGSLAGTPAPEKKPVKKRKSWGQQLPEPKTNLPPRKRAKTEDEKEQRRVERVLRNRRAAQSSRERKRQEVEALEAEKRQIERRRNNDLELQLANMATRCAELEKRLQKATGGIHGDLSPTFLPSANTTPSRQQTFNGQSPIALTKDLFAEEQDPSIRQLMMTPQTLKDTHNTMQSAISPTVNPLSLSSPPPMESDDKSSFNAASFDLTQHSAAMLCLDNYSLGANDVGNYFDNPETLGADQDFFNQRVEPIADSFTNDFNNLAGDNIGAANDLFFDAFINQNPEITQSAPEVHSSDLLAEKTLSLQSHHGASSSGCDVGGNAVIV